MRIAVFLILFGFAGQLTVVVAQDKSKKNNQWIRNDAFDGWISLFHGNPGYGWRAVTNANWSCVDNRDLTVSRGQAGLLRSTTQFDDFSIRLQFKATPRTNSGVFIRTSPSPNSPLEGCYEINIAPQSNSYPTGSIVGRVKGTVIKDFDYSIWHRMEISAIGNTISVKIDGQKTSVYRDPKPIRKGYIGLQFNQGAVAFRNIYLKPEGLVSLFNGKSLAGWKEYPEMKSKFSAEGGVLNVKDGSGQLETKNLYQNFVMQLKVKTNAPKLNSGIFFRCIPGEKMNGYESQIQNGIIDNDRSRPEDCGTGGIFRRKNARIVPANDQEWFIKTLVVDGPHVATWVNGEQVCDWTDQRKPDANPRKGLRLKAGTIMIQGHDPTTDIDFKDLLIREMKSRR
ncbi:MAG: DUF1080 domain-containing protein [Planctomycetota bacterium]|nr:DUF1080 domain-containing protein [Planctomycetota bacterium]